MREPPALTADAIVARLGLQPHPEGGYYRETFRDTRTIDGGRAVSTAIYFLLARGQTSHWHRVDAVEIWHYHAGEQPQAVVPAHAWQAAESTGDWTLVGCTVAPGFDFAKFELAPPDWSPA
ncbi:MAG: cupin domain-containing protein [Candidatus Afipia apatlaquensis]|uniref:Cupin domain-containing protein n=1 Tax=Candidatus Afipia apatlaquensis TaxID=2712852 RepID=A0A7C9RH30_9BRAD|nr:cupin domain-containing protein [Candidatus Afipia apatlaquensis]